MKKFRTMDLCNWCKSENKKIIHTENEWSVWIVFYNHQCGLLMKIRLFLEMRKEGKSTTAQSLISWDRSTIDYALSVPKRPPTIHSLLDQKRGIGSIVCLKF